MSTFIYDMSDNWNNSGTTFNAIKMNVTDTASLADSKLLDLQISGITKFNIDKTGNVTAINVYANTGTIGANLLSGTLTTSSQPNITSVGTLSGLSVNGDVTAANITANTGVFTGNGSGLNSLNASNISTGTLAQARLANSNVILGNTTLALGTTTTTVTGLSSVTSTTFVGELTGAATTAGTVTTNAQPNITSVGTLTSLTVSGNANVGNLSTSGTVAATGNITGGNLSTSGIVAATGNISGNNIVSGNTLTAGDTLILNTDYTEKLFTDTGTSFTIDLSNGTIQKFVTAGSTTITLPASVIGKSYMVIVEYGGAHNLTWAGGTSIKWAGNIVPVPTSTLGRIDIFTFFCDGVNTYAGVFGQNF